MFILLENELTEKLNSFENIEPTWNAPEGLTMEETDTFLRILQAKKPEDIEDIPTEKILTLLHLVECIAPCIGNSSIFDNTSNNFKSKLLEKPSMKRRRVL